MALAVMQLLRHLVRLARLRPTLTNRNIMKKQYEPLHRKNKEKIMKQIVTVTEVEGEGLEALLGQNVLLFCLNYIYTGKLVGVNSTFVKLEGAKIVYETG